MKSLLEAYLFELIDRNIRFYMHLDRIKDEFYIDERGGDKIAFIEEYKLCLRKQFEMVHVISKKIQSPMNAGHHFDLLLSQIRSGITLIGRLHRDGLHFLPRPSEPVELKRFSRIIDSQYIKWPPNKQDMPQRMSFFPTEDISETVYNQSALEIFKDELNSYVNEYNITRKELGDPSLPQIDGIEPYDPSGKSLHITIPRIDSANPARWPTLLHEIAHNIIADEFFSVSMLEDFKCRYSEAGPYVQNVFQGDDKKLEQWLLECWCDIFATFIIGPSFFFSQYSAFLFAEPTCSSDHILSQNYPPASMRLKLILVVMQHRWSIVSNVELYELLSDALRMYREVAAIPSENENTFYTQRDIDGVYQLFKDFFLGAFFKDDTPVTGESLKDVVKEYFKKTEEIDLDLINDMVSDIGKGYPVPSARISPDKIDERPTSLQEILLSAWIYRQRNLRKDVVSVLSANKSDDECHSEILEAFTRYDQSILRSIQVSEWVQLFFTKNKPYEIDDIDGGITPEPGGMLVDYEIYRLLTGNKLTISPLIDAPANSIRQFPELVRPSGGNLLQH